MASTYKMIPSDKFLPNPAILEKLEAKDEGAAIAVFALTVELAEQRRIAEMDLLLVDEPYTFKNFFEDIVSFFNERANFGQEILTPEQSQNYAWAQTGNDMRHALRVYCKDNPHIVEAANLTNQDMEDMKPLALWVSPRCAELLSYLSEKERPIFAEKLDLVLAI